jgi:hypothetical protein
MEAAPQWVSLLIAVTGLLGSLVTAVATIFLWRVTKVLAVETTRMAEASAQPHVVATLTPNRWSIKHFDLHIDNTGNATAYDIETSFDPPLENGGARGEKAIPLQNVSVLKPNQGLNSFLSEYELLKGKKYSVTVTWRNPQKLERERNVYTLNMADNEGISRLGDDPLIQIADQIKKIQETWEPIARGSKRTEIDIFSSEDRTEEFRKSREQHEQWRTRDELKRSQTPPDEPNSAD